MRKRYRRWGRTAVAVALTLAGGLDVTPSAASRTSSQAALGTCWLSKLNIGLGEDINAHDYVTRWHAGSVSTIITGPAPHSRLWSLTIYHARRGQMQSFYDQQIVSSDQRSTFSLTIGGPRTDAKGAWIDPTANGGDDQGYPNFRVYKPAGTTTLPNVTYTARGALPSTLTSCSSMSSYLRAAIARADKAHPGKGQTVGQSARHNLWPNNTNPFHDWSILNRPAHVGRAPKRCLGPAAYPTGRP